MAGSSGQEGTPGAAFGESHVEADGFTIRYFEAGKGDALLCLHGSGGLRLSGAHDLLAKRYRVLAFELPGFGDSPVNDRSETLDELAATMNAAAAALGLDRYSLMGNSFGAKLALSMALSRPEPLHALVLVASAAIRPDDQPPPRLSSPEEAMALLYSHPERHTPLPPVDPKIEAKQQALVRRLIGPGRDTVFEDRLSGLDIPVLALFGTGDRIIRPEVADIYPTLLPNCHPMMVYDAAHAVDADRPEAVASVVADFIERGESFLVNDQSALIHP